MLPKYRLQQLELRGRCGGKSDVKDPSYVFKSRRFRAPIRKTLIGFQVSKYFRKLVPSDRKSLQRETQPKVIIEEALTTGKETVDCAYSTLPPPGV